MELDGKDSLSYVLLLIALYVISHLKGCYPTLSCT